jgi:Fe-S-cluster-containing dehydrogenase component
LWLTGAAQLAWDAVARGEPEAAPNYKTTEHWWAMAIDIDQCIGCGNCVRACKEENDVPREPFYFRTWVERYHVPNGGIEHPEVDSPDGGYAGFPEKYRPGDGAKAFFVPKLCNHCDNAPCVQVCPVKATFATPDGAVIVDRERCIGCRYCIQACPYGARFLNPRTHTADKCTFCYHRVTRGLLPACVEVCPTQARIFGDLRSKASRLVRFFRTEKIHVLKPDLNTKPKVYYAELDGEVR